MTVTLANAEKFSLSSTDGTCDIAARIACPRARYTWLAKEVSDEEVTLNEWVFPSTAPWSMITRQFTRNPVEVTP